MEYQTYISTTDFKRSDFERFVIVADIGGENSYAAIMGMRDNRNYSIIFKKTMPTREIVKVHELLNGCLAEAYHNYGIEIGRAVIAAAGPVSRHRGYIKLTNIDLTINAQEIIDNSLLHKVILLNDFEAIGYGLDVLDIRTDAILLKHVGDDLTMDDFSNTAAVIGAGSGLGMSIIYFDKAKHIHVPLPSEGGHKDLPVQDEVEFELLQYLKEFVMPRKYAHPEFERVLSHNGLMNIYGFLRLKELYPETDATRKIDALEGREKFREIERHIDDDQTCKAAVELFVKFYAQAARNLALMSECYSGLFLVGGMASKYPELFNDGKFMAEFETHDQRTDVLRKIPVYLIMNMDVGLLGCCNVAVNFYNIM